MNAETIKKASAIYFSLLKERVIDETSEHFESYFEPEVRQTVLLLADESGTYIIEAPKRIHLVVQPTGSVFATNFTHMRDKHNQVETKKQFHLMSVILMSFLASMDQNQVAKIRTKREGISFYSLERKVDELIMNWDRSLKSMPNFGDEERIDMKEVVTMWKYMEVDRADASLRKVNKRTRIGLIASSMRLLETEGLVVILDWDDIPKVIPKQELFERIEYLYHDYERYEFMKKLVSEEEGEHAEDTQD
ncbi:DUF6063 family protein [Oceanobacillus sp. FSL H7-0719]|uniref:DUF6063 family protein n=1 Tax=Oceanobacillus sp. FSL H7-0719 TaxID=2954507 RepID=UPI00324FB4D1